MLFITFVVLLVMLVMQGLSLPALIRLTKIVERDNQPSLEEQEAGVRLNLRQATVAHLQHQYPAELVANEGISRF